MCDLKDADVLPEPGLGAYNKETCCKFHRLLIATLLAYGKALEALYAIKPSKAMGDFQVKVEAVWICGLLLWRIANSKMIGHHLYILHESGWLHEPTNDRSTVNIYNNYTSFKNLGCLDASPDGEEDEGFQGAGADGQSQWDVTFGDWLRLQVVYWVALDLLSAYSGKEGTLQELKVSHINLKHAGTLPVEPWRDTVIQLLAPNGPYQPSSPEPNLEAEAIIALLEKEIKQAIERPDRNAIFYQFSRPVFECSPNIHCEAALSALVDHVNNRTSVDEKFISDDLEEIIRVRFHLCYIDVHQMTCCQHRMRILAGLRCQSRAVLFVGSFCASLANVGASHQISKLVNVILLFLR